MFTFTSLDAAQNRRLVENATVLPSAAAITRTFRGGQSLL